MLRSTLATLAFAIFLCLSVFFWRKFSEPRATAVIGEGDPQVGLSVEAKQWEKQRPLVVAAAKGFPLVEVGRGPRNIRMKNHTMIDGRPVYGIRFKAQRVSDKASFCWRFAVTKGSGFDEWNILTQNPEKYGFRFFSEPLKDGAKFVIYQGHLAKYFVTGETYTIFFRYKEGFVPPQDGVELLDVQLAFDENIDFDESGYPDFTQVGNLLAKTLREDADMSVDR